MEAFILHNEPIIRLGFFLGVLILVAIWEFFAPKRVLLISKLQRWSSNLGLVVLNTVVLRLLFPFAAVGVAVWAQQQGWGLFNAIERTEWVAIVGSIIVLDFAIWLQHVIVHAIPLLWRLHRVHHADLDYDVTTGLRFHPLEIVLSMLIKFSVILLLGPPVVAVIMFEVILNATAMFNHGNIHLPSKLDRVIRWFIVTPDMHRVHHSVEEDETNSNFGFNLSVWDRIFGTYRSQPRLGHQQMVIGISEHRDPKRVDQLPGMLWLPFKGSVNAYAINRRNWEQKDEK